MLTIKSSAFSNEGPIPSKYTCQGQDINPPLEIEGLPSGTVSLALIMDDPDAPMGTWDHWVLFNIPLTHSIPENSVPKGAMQGKNSWGKNKYGGPCPPSGTHRYFFKVYALKQMLPLSLTATKKDVETALRPLIIAQATLMGTYKKA